MKRKIYPGKIPTRDLHQFLLGAVAPRPIAFVGTIDENGNDNLAPYSFFNVFSSNPPMAVFSSNRRVVDNTTKDTLHNIEKNKECVINVVSHSIVRQMAVSSVQFDPGVSEYEKSGLTPVDSELVKPKRVLESPVNMECKVQQIIPLGSHGGAGHLILCEIVLMHINESVIDENDRIDPHKIDLMGRNGRAYYTRSSGDAIETIVQAVTEMVIGYDALPKFIRESEQLNGNEIGQLAGNTRFPTAEEIDEIQIEYQENLNDNEQIMCKAKELLQDDNRLKALSLLMTQVKKES